MQIIDLKAEHEIYINEAAQILFDCFRTNWPEAWPTIEAAKEEVRECCEDKRIVRVAIDTKTDKVFGWVGAIPERKGRVWEVHPLAVKTTFQNRGIGTLLMRDIETCVKARGGLTLWLGSDDENGMTTVSNRDLYPDPLSHLAKINNIKGHPYTFYLKQGFSLSGILPDANGLGKPDIFMAKRVEHKTQEKL